MTTVDALKNLYVAIGGSAADVKNVTKNPEMINAITSLVTSQGIAALPAVTAADNGKVLKVVEGEWAVGSDATE